MSTVLQVFVPIDDRSDFTGLSHDSVSNKMCYTWISQPLCSSWNEWFKSCITQSCPVYRRFKGSSWCTYSSSVIFVTARVHAWFVVLEMPERQGYTRGLGRWSV